MSPATVADVPTEVVTVMSTAPVPEGETAVTWLSLFTVNEVAALVPNFTAVAPVKPEPVTVTDVPPVVAPPVGLIAVICGAPDPCSWVGVAVRRARRTGSCSRW